MRKLYLVALLSGLAAATPAFAQDTGAPATGNAPMTGLRVEGIAGWDRINTNPGHGDGVAYGGVVGYDIGLGSNAIIGVEGEVDGSTMRDCDNGVFAAGDRLCSRAGRDLYVGGRIGTRVGGNTLLYAKAGYTNARLTTTYNDGTGAGLGNFRTSDDLDGWRLGAGAEFGLGAHTYLKAEYRYSNYEHDIDRHQVVAGVGVRF